MSNPISITITCEGKNLTETYNFVTIDIIKAVNKIPHAQLVLLDGNIAQEKFLASDSSDFEPGKSIEIELSFQNKPDTKAIVFKGIIVRHRIKAIAGNSHLILDIKDEAYKLVTQSTTAVYQGKDDEIIKKIAKSRKVTIGEVASTKVQHKQMVQYNANDWDFILARADANGLWVVADDNKLSVFDPQVNNGKNKFSYTYGMDTIYELEMEVDARQQLNSVQAVAWDIAKQAQAQPVDAADFKVKQGNLSAATIAQKVTGGNYALQSFVDIENAEIKAWADAKLMKSRLAFLRGYITVEGLGKAKIGDTLELAGISKAFNGANIITSIRHNVSADGGWLTSLQFGINAQWYHEQTTITDVPAAGLLPAVNGIQIGIVKKLEDDPDSKFRIQVVVPAFGSKENEVWARLAAPYATKEAGFFFIPEVGDEVIIGFFNDDPRQAVILGSMYNPKLPPPLTFTKDNNQKGIIIKKDATHLLFDTKEKTFALTTSQKTKLVAKDEDNIEIAVKDEQLKLVVSSGIAAQSKQTLEVNAQEIKQTSKGAFAVKAASGLDINCDANIAIKGAKVDVQ